MNYRKQTSDEVARKYKLGFAIFLGKRCIPQQSFDQNTPNIVLCEIFEKMNQSQKKGIWVDVSKFVGDDRSDKWAAKHYANAFRRALFPEELLSEHKDRIKDLCLKLYGQVDNGQIAFEAREMFKDTKLFPEAISSYVFQTIAHIKKGQIQLHPTITDLFPLKPDNQLNQTNQTNQLNQTNLINQENNIKSEGENEDENMEQENEEKEQVKDKSLLISEKPINQYEESIKFLPLESEQKINTSNALEDSDILIQTFYQLENQKNEQNKKLVELSKKMEQAPDLASAMQILQSIQLQSGDFNWFDQGGFE